ncbi:M14 family zinc carboxypeptidase [Psychroserpens sp.]|uniref:M14 family zinc carboxypeptidase n=1 Tax=Psychroserpens sp. TaxID=2020870 RepID=UPI002B271C5B|nr:M14 family zinc carboxypeptidase [Psychroserpens sp.]
MKKITLTLAALLLFLLNVNSQILQIEAQDLEKEKAEKYITTKGELTFTFQIERAEDLEILTRNMSLVNYDSSTKTVKAWANETQFRQFETKNIPFTIPKSENEVDESAIYDVRPLAARAPGDQLSFPLTSYPTYAEYEHQMEHFEDDNPGLVEMVSIGLTGQGDKELLFVKISDNVATDEQEPKLMLTSSMHGDEIAGYPMMLTLIDYIITVYNNTGHADHARVKNLVENAEIWINPSANPDGTYHNSASNTSVVQARRGNGNNIDLNRNYPDNVAGPHDDGNAYQTETLAFMALADAHDFVISANFHGGTELVNYPFDNAYSAQYIHADNDWFEHIGVEYATHCQTDANSGTTSTPAYTNKASYMTDDDDWDENAGNQAWHNDYAQSPGVTHGAEWYRVYGGRQDYMNFYQQCREVTIELSDVKILAESSLDDYWYYNRDALLDYLTQGTYGFRGVVEDAITNNPIEDVKVTVVGHDAYGSEIYTDNHGAYYRPIKGGTYSLLFEAPCYQSVTVSSQSITDGTTVTLANVQLTPIIPSVPNSLNASAITTNSATLSWSSTGSIFDLRYREVGAPSWIDVLGLTTNSHNLTGLSIASNYEFEVRSICGASTSVYSASFSFTTSSVSYCASQGNDFSDEFISRVQLNTIDNNSGAQGYSDFTNIKTTLIPGESYTITVTPQWTGSTYSEGYRVWIDYNRDGTFTTAERVMNQSPTQNTSVSATFNVPSGVVLGTTRMRVSMRYNTLPNTCGSYDYGEVEDYTINLFDGLVYSANTWTPNAPTNLTASKNVLIEDGTYNVISTDISMNNLTVNSGAIINVDQASNVTLGGNIINNGVFTLNSDSNEFSSLLVDGTVMGDVEYKRHVTSNSGGNDIIAPPVSGEAFTSFISNNSNVFANSGQTLYLFGPFEKPLNDYGLFSNVEAVNLEAAKGYRAASTNDDTFTFTGAVTTGPLTVPIIHSGTDYAKWNLIGNPYTSYIKLEDFLSANLNELDPNTVAVYGYDADLTFGTEWTIWNMAYSDNNPGALIAPGQGFFVSSKVAGSNVSFTPSMRSTGTTDDFIAGRNANLAHFVITMSKPDRTYNTDIYFKDNATLGLNIGYDAELFSEEPSTFSIYTELTESGQDLNMAIQTIGFDDVNGTTVIPVGINLLQGQQVTIGMDTSDLQYNVYFEDTLTNTVTLLNTSDYNLTATTDLIGTGRFYVRFEAETLSVLESNLNELQIYNNSDTKEIIVKGQLTEATSFVLYDIQGRAILRTDLDTSNVINTIDASNYSKGVYLVQLTDAVSTISKKLIIR